MIKYEEYSQTLNQEHIKILHIAKFHSKPRRIPFKQSSNERKLASTDCSSIQIQFNFHYVHEYEKL